MGARTKQARVDRESGVEKKNVNKMFVTCQELTELPIEVMRDRLKTATTSRNGLNKKYSNIYCLHETPSSSHKHIKKTLDKNLKIWFECDICGHKTWSMRNTKEHTLVHHYKEHYVCPICFKKYNSSANMTLQRHVNLWSELLKQMIEQKEADESSDKEEEEKKERKRKKGKGMIITNIIERNDASSFLQLNDDKMP